MPVTENMPPSDWLCEQTMTSQCSDRRHKSTQPTQSQSPPVDADEKLYHLPTAEMMVEKLANEQFINRLGMVSICVSLYLMSKYSQSANPMAQLVISFGVGGICKLFFQKYGSITRMLRFIVDILLFIVTLVVFGCLIAWICGVGR